MVAKTEYKFIHGKAETINQDLAQHPGWKPILMTGVHAANAAGIGNLVVFMVLEHKPGD